jgi:hypothetical protein
MGEKPKKNMDNNEPDKHRDEIKYLIKCFKRQIIE